MNKKRIISGIFNMLIGISLITVFPIKTTAETAKYTGLESGAFMRRWMVLGPIPAIREESENRDFDALKAAFEQELLPTDGLDNIQTGKSVQIYGKTFVWQYVDSDENSVDLDKLFDGADFAVAYACADIVLENPEKMLLGVGSDDGVKIWLNGEPVHQNWIARGVNPDDDLVAMHLKKGTNRLIIKVQDMEYGWGFCCRAVGEEQVKERFSAAVREGSLDQIKMLIRNGADVNTINEAGFTPYHLARIYRQSDAAKYLVEQGADTTVHMPATADPDHIPEFLDELVPKLMAIYKVPGVSIVGIENRQIAWDRQYGVLRAGSEQKVDRNTLFEACSMSKPVLAYLALKLVEQGRLDLDRPLVKYLDKPYLNDQPLYERITARMVLSHTTGFPNWRPGGWQSGNPLIVEFEPGTQFNYSGEGFLYLQRVIEHITGTPYCEYVDNNLFKPLGLTLSSHEWQDCFAELASVRHNAQGEGEPGPARFDTAVSAYSLCCTPLEYARFIVEILKTDRSAAHSLSARSLDLMCTRTAKTGWKQTLRSGAVIDDEPWFGLGWMIEKTASGDRISHSGSNGGSFRQMCYSEFDREHGTGIVIMTNAVGGYPLYREIIALAASP